MRVLEPHTLTVLPTSRCTAECRHCAMSSGPHRTESIGQEDLEKILTEVFAAAPSLQIVVFAGGEPTLIGDALHRAIRLCAGHGLLTRVVTNAYWATSAEVARDKVQALRDAGLHELNISTDDFHLPFVSLQRVRWAFEAAIEAGFLSVVITTCCGGDAQLQPEALLAEFGGPAVASRSLGGEMKLRFDDEGEQLANYSEFGRTSLVLSNNAVQAIGAGVEGLHDWELPDQPPVEERARTRLGCIYTLRSAAISPNGHLLACCGFELEGNEVLDFGDATTEPMSALLDRADDDLLANMIALVGPPNIKRILESAVPDEVSFSRERYRSYCEVCSDLVKIEQNRRALYRHQGRFAPAIAAARERLKARFTHKGRVRIPINVSASTGLFAEP